MVLTGPVFGVGYPGTRGHLTYDTNGSSYFTARLRMLWNNGGSGNRLADQMHRGSKGLANMQADGKTAVLKITPTDRSGETEARRERR